MDGKTIKLPLVSIKGLVMFPNSTVNLELGISKSILALEQIKEENTLVFFATQKDHKEEMPVEKDIYQVGTISTIKKISKLPNNMFAIVAEGIKRATITEFIKEEPYFEVVVNEIEEKEINTQEKEVMALMQLAKEVFKEYYILLGKALSESIAYINSLECPSQISDVILCKVKVINSTKQKFLEEIDPIERLRKTIKLLEEQKEVVVIQKEILIKVRQNVDKHQKDYYLREHLKVIKNELGEKDSIETEINSYKERMKNLQLPKLVVEKINKEISRLRRNVGFSQEGVLIRDYIDLILDLPWNIKSEENNNLKKAQDILNLEHYGLKKVKERVIEFLAVRQNTNNLDAPILCLVGPPGVGKTSIAKSIAKALNRKHTRISLGGVHDESEIRGHRKTYVGAMPGRIISCIKNVGVSNPIILLDEIDKMGKGIKGDPTSALLEVLDGEQNQSFRDNYVELPYDISDVLFICTANNLDSIPYALKDRLDIIQLSSYTFEEKKNIVTNFLIQRQTKKHGLDSSKLLIQSGAVDNIIRYYTKEAGVRNLERLIGSLCRKAVKELLTTDKKEIIIYENSLEDYLGKPRFKKDRINRTPEVGVVNGLAWTILGGDILSIEVNKAKGKGKLKLTGNMGNIMKESALAGLSYIRSNSDKLSIDKDFYKNTDIHIHIPEGSTPKDGPSAGITMATAMISSLSNRAVINDVGMTGEITIRGKVLAIGGLKEKVLAAKQAGIKKVLIPIDNKHNLDELEDYVKAGLEFVLVKDMEEVLDSSLV